MDKVKRIGQQKLAYWIEPLDLREADTQCLVMRDWLNDVHIAAASKLLQKQYLTRMVSNQPSISQRSSNGSQALWTLSDCACRWETLGVCI